MVHSQWNVDFSLCFGAKSWPIYREKLGETGHFLRWREIKAWSLARFDLSLRNDS
jgi:hypothetical protein